MAIGREVAISYTISRDVAGQGGRQPIGPGNRGVLPLATVIASVSGLRYLARAWRST